MVYGKQLPVLTYDKEFVEANEKKYTTSLFLYPSAHTLLGVFSKLTGMTANDSIVEGLIAYTKLSRIDKSDNDTVGVYPQNSDPKELPIAIASDTERKMNRKKRKHGKSLMPQRSEVFKDENLVMAGVPENV